MSGTLSGGQKAAETNVRRYGDTFYKTIGALGGKAEYTRPKGFAVNRELAREVGRKGGMARRNV